MKKLILILGIIAFTGQDIVAQVSNEGNGRIWRNTGAADRGPSTSQGPVFAEQGDWSVDLVVSEKPPSVAANEFLGPTHDGMGAIGWGSFGAGAYNRASGIGSVAIGFHNIAGPTDTPSSTIPPSALNSGGQFAVGYGTQATGHASFSSGEGTIASNQAATSMGFGTTADNVGMFAIGVNNAAEIGNIVPGDTAGSYYNTTYNGGPPEALGQPTGDVGVAFVIGNGDVDVTVNLSNGVTESVLKGANPSNAFKVMFNGDTTVSNNLTVSGDIVVSSDARLKANIVSLGSTLARLLLIDGKTYTMKKDGKQKIGVLAQDIQNVFPELVSEDDNEMLAVNYQGLVPVLINALKEQDDKISRLEVLVEKLMSDK